MCVKYPFCGGISTQKHFSIDMIISNTCMCTQDGGMPTQEHFSIGMIISSLYMCVKCGGIPTQKHFSIGMIIPSPYMCARYGAIPTQNQFSISIIIYNMYMCTYQVSFVLDDGSLRWFLCFVCFRVGHCLSKHFSSGCSLVYTKVSYSDELEGGGGGVRKWGGALMSGRLPW